MLFYLFWRKGWNKVRGTIWVCHLRQTKEVILWGLSLKLVIKLIQVAYYQSEWYPMCVHVCLNSSLLFTTEKYSSVWMYHCVFTYCPTSIPTIPVKWSPQSFSVTSWMSWMMPRSHQDQAQISQEKPEESRDRKVLSFKSHRENFLGPSLKEDNLQSIIQLTEVLNGRQWVPFHLFPKTVRGAGMQAGLCLWESVELRIKYTHSFSFLWPEVNIQQS
jgi:hypothetical protein